mmetsp:Transcript_8612/g.10797  ORF Transcript_8612/g.10797 Transcript_8612/m.10797 type:complete len:441 (-) Transcript_8612:108-1430(-)
MVKFLILFLTALVGAAAIDTNRKVAKPEDIQKIVKKSSASLSRSTQTDPEACFIADAAIYNGTAIAPAEYTSFLFTYVWTDPTFDMKGFFDALDFDAQCASLGGAVYQPEILLQCEAGTFSWTEFKFCQPTICTDDFIYKFMKDVLILTLSEYSGCRMSLVDDDVPSATCVLGIGEIYSEGTPLADFAPEGALSEEGLAAIEELGSCKQFGKGGIDIGVCQMTDLKQEYELITNLCETTYEAKIMPFDMMLSVPFYHRTLRRYPVCLPNACSLSDALLYYGYMASMYESGATTYYPGLEIDVDFNLSLKNTCDENPKDKAFMKQYNGNLAIKSCKWLKRRPEDLKMKYCNKKAGAAGFEPAGAVCPSTCCLCEETDDDVFLKKMSVGTDGSVTLEKKTCSWLQTLPADKVEFHCGKTAASFVGGLPPAAAACPQTCGCSE